MLRSWSRRDTLRGFQCSSQNFLLDNATAQVYPTLHLPSTIYLTLNRRPATLQLPQVPRAVYSSPDGSCVLVVQEKEDVSTVTAYHWTTFASTNGIPITLPHFPVDLDAALLTSIVNRNNIHLIGLDITSQTCRSVILDITCKATEFTFQAQRSKASTSHGKETAHNCLIDCHSEVWARFPVVAAVKRRTITFSSKRQQRTLTFVTDDHQRPFSSYFSKLIHSFTRTSHKPTSDVLEGTTVSTRTFTSFACAFLSSREWPVSRFRAGEWLADLLCLIPIHIAITHENRFVPLKDGVLSPELERSLLGAEVNRIVDSLSVGWYESIFQSYWASKVRLLCGHPQTTTLAYITTVLARKGCIIDGRCRKIWKVLIIGPGCNR